MIKFGADPNNLDDERGVGFTQVGSFALQLAAKNNLENTVELLINKKANVNLADQNGRTALMTASAHGHKGVTQKLVEYGIRN